MPLRKASGQLLPLKTSDSRFDTKKYGGYKNPAIDYFMLVESDGKRKKIRTLEGVPVYLANASNDVIEKYLEKNVGLKNPDIRIRKIRINSLIKVNGFPMHISGKSSARILTKNAAELCLSADEEYLIHKIEKVIEKQVASKEYRVSEFDGIEEDKLIQLYDVFTNKLEYTCYSKCPGNQLNTLKTGRDKFLILRIEDMCRVLYEILHLFQCNALLANLTLIGGVGQAGKTNIGKEISKQKKVILVNQSVTGLFEQETDLLMI